MALTVRKVEHSTAGSEKGLQKVQSPLHKSIWHVLNYLLLILLSIFFLFPTVFMVVSSLKTNEGQLLQDLSSVKALIPYGNISLQNYSDASQRLPFALYMVNSVMIVTSIVVLGLFVNSLTAYALARIPFPGRKLIVVLIVVAIIIPFESVVVPLLLMVNQFPWFDGSTTWVNSYQVQIIPFIADAFSIFLFYQFFVDIPKTIEDAAFVDGAGRWRIYWQVVVPMARPVFATVAIWQFLTHIGDFLWPLLVTRGDTYRPLMVGMAAFFGQSPLKWGDVMAFATLITLPMLILFLIFQKWFLRTAAVTGTKG